MNINKFYTSQAEEVAELIKRNLMEISSQYYPPAYMAAIARDLLPEKLIENAKYVGISLLFQRLFLGKRD